MAQKSAVLYKKICFSPRYLWTPICWESPLKTGQFLKRNKSRILRNSAQAFLTEFRKLASYSTASPYVRNATRIFSHTITLENKNQPRWN